ncbi:hypothetical protein K439DRAFT_1617243 [Ramaria rubella]|nr:hypothetical protein K439DRAFT_1624711 [Ramaria rubella]KAF8583711.1 hypothetical protein K439DRAFT_1617243 [Ramaria rubella]
MAKEFSIREQALKIREEALEQAKIVFEEDQAAWQKKQMLIRRGASIMFKVNRLEAQQEKEEQEQAMNALEEGLLQTTQQDLDAIDFEHERIITNLLASTAAQLTCAAAAVEAKARADMISDRLTVALDQAYSDRLHLQELTHQVEERSAELDGLVSSAKADRTKAHEYLQSVRTKFSQFSLAAETIVLIQRQVETNNAPAMVPHDRNEGKPVDKNSEEEALQEARIETQKRLAALKDARAAFEKLREAEKANLAKGHARVEQSRIAVDMEKELVKKEMVRARLLAIKAEQERAASVDAKKAALQELQEAVVMRDESRRTLHKLATITDGEKRRSNESVASELSKGESEDIEVKGELTKATTFRFGFMIDRRRTVSQGQIEGTTSMVDTNATGALPRETSIAMKEKEQSLTSVASTISSPYPGAVNNKQSVILMTAGENNTHGHNISIRQKNWIMAENRGVARTIENKSVEKHFSTNVDCDTLAAKHEQPNRMKLGNIGNTIRRNAGVDT